MDMLVDGELYDSETGELINEVEQVEAELINEDTLPAIICNGGTHIQTNTIQLKKELVVYLKKYDIEVTAETEKEAAKTATVLNKLAKDLNSKRLEVSREIKKPADALKTSIDELIDIVQEKRTDILEKVEVFKTKRMDTLKNLLIKELNKLYETHKVSDKYCVVDINPLIKEGSMGKTKLSKNALESLESMVRRVKALEDSVTIRELQLDMTCKNKGLDFSIELDEVQHIIQEDNYDEQLNTMIENRLAIQERMKEKAIQEAKEREEQLKREEERKAKILEQQRLAEIEREKQEREQREAFRISELARVEREKEEAIQKVKDEAIAKENARLAEIERVEESKRYALEMEEKQRLQKIEDEAIAKEKAEKETGKKIVTLFATFETEVDSNIDDEKVRSKYLEKLSKEYTTLKELIVR